MNDPEWRLLSKGETIYEGDEWADPAHPSWRKPLPGDVGHKVSEVSVAPIRFRRKREPESSLTMTVNIVTTTGVNREIPNANAAFYSEINDQFIVHVNGEEVFSMKMGDISEIEICL